METSVKLSLPPAANMATRVKRSGCVLMNGRESPYCWLDALLCSATTFQTWEGGSSPGAGRS